MQPGETITPGAQQAPEPEKQDAAPVAAPAQQPATQEVAPLPQEPSANWQFTGSEAEPQPPAPASSTQPVTWTASEYIAHNKGASWFALLGLCLFGFILVIYLITRDIVASVMVGVAGAAFGAFAARSPRVLEYAITEKGIQIGQKFHPYADFKSFSVIDEGPLPSVMLLPLKRFLPPITVFYEPEAENTILNALADYLPHEDKQPDAVDKLMRHIRF